MIEDKIAEEVEEVVEQEPTIEETEEVVKCNHNPEIRNNETFKLLPQRKLVFPQEYDFFCTCCKRLFRYEKGKDGIFVEIK